MATIDGVLPPIPSESVVIAVAVLSTTGDGPPLYQLVLVAALGAFGGDLTAYAIGRRLPLRRAWIFRSAHGQAALDWAERALATRGTSFILGARFVPVGRVAVNMTAGATGFPLLRFLPIAATAGVLWAGYTATLGLSAGVFLGEHPLLAIGVGVVLGFVIGIAVDAVTQRRAARGPNRPSEGPAAHADDAPPG